MDKDPDAFRTISEAAADLDLPQHVLRFWESRFAQIKPLKRAGGRRYYRSSDIDLLRAVKKLLHVDGYTIKGVQRLLKEKGGQAVLVAAHGARVTAGAEPQMDSAAASLPASIKARPLAQALPPPPSSAVSIPFDAPALHSGFLEAAIAELAFCSKMLRDARA
jgi:DNA-binding transcriptional MerR regulator